MHTDEEGLNKLTEIVIGCAFKVSNVLGCGFAEKVYENALKYEIAKAGLAVEQQKDIRVYYDGILVGDYCADLFVEGEILIELKAAKSLDEAHIAQCLNYLKATGITVCLLINFGKRVEVRRLRL